MSSLPPEEVNRFVVAARGFVDLCETSHANDDRNSFRDECVRRLAELYFAALNLPHNIYGDGPDIPPETEEERKRLISNLDPLPFQIYWTALEPANLEKDGNVACGDIFDDFLDIHADVGDGLWLFDQGYWEAAVSHWRLMYFHWSNHVIGALNALHLFEPPDAAESADGN